MQKRSESKPNKGTIEGLSTYSCRLTPVGPMMGPMNLTCLLNMDTKKVEGNVSRFNKTSTERHSPLGARRLLSGIRSLGPRGPRVRGRIKEESASEGPTPE